MDPQPSMPVEVNDETEAVAAVQASVWRHNATGAVLRFLSTFGIETRRKVRSTMLEYLRAHRDTLQNFIVTSSRDIPLETLSSGMGRVLGTCLQILQDGVSVLNSLIEYLDRE